jgi:hypothetical protein
MRRWFKDEDVDQFGEVFGVGCEFLNALGYEFSQVWGGVMLGCVVDGCVGTQWVHGAPFAWLDWKEKPAKDCSRAGSNI